MGAILTTLVIAAITFEAVEMFLVMLLILSLISSSALLLSRIFVFRLWKSAVLASSFARLRSVRIS